ncbi:tRNA (adenosine(37)-N6)-threonylcarbamoyltransferase complex ATPase subunit type 1 TsaE [Marinomonas sp. C2222]|uniref:tRNA threonylcarbamoyladenosine biosynthesis protein TsaE n=1 Tax=Marinomonas sargassi TaxID=2984494 RepID=A0ABT2YTB5_9GAMM|nr:tRNA (adenosine(37)-N6)-threonylcarbamoyltransferase complex ATPase subunit type 1 TsaE [Marinomonas sargassi]MCV2403105.1 tRNA (adenosine(37)-N6)-threonylcarbamoyltransferase complex ATPase subunit type 1 TsaE [Marinomonas sargassi]
MQIEMNVFGEDAMEKLGAAFSSSLKEGAVVYLEGDLGMGKTTLVRGVLRGLGHEGAVKSPTYTLVEPYDVSGFEAYHFDLYRLSDPEELEYMGVRDYFSETSLCFIEWAEMGRGVLPEADLIVSLSFIKDGRHVVFSAKTEKGKAALSSLKG